MSDDCLHTPAVWEKIADRPHADCRVFSVVRRELKHPARAASAEFFVIKAMDWVLVLAETGADEYLLVHQYRFGAEKLSWEFPAGCIDGEESPIDAAKRELLEETGYAGESAEIIGWSHPNPPLQENTCWYVLVRNARKVAQTDWDPHEEIACASKPLPQIEAMVAQGTFFHAVAQAGLLSLLLYKKRSGPVDHS